MKFGSDILAPLWINYNGFVDPLTFHVAPSGQNKQKHYTFLKRYPVEFMTSFFFVLFVFLGVGSHFVCLLLTHKDAHAHGHVYMGNAIIYRWW